jgi:hypothetical protein
MIAFRVTTQTSLLVVRKTFGGNDESERRQLGVGVDIVRRREQDLSAPM